MKVLIGTPTAGEVVTSAYAGSLIAASRVFHRLGWDYAHAMFDGADVALARNWLAGLILENAGITHLLFLDSDMAVGEEVFTRLARAERAMVGAIYPERRIDLERFAALSGQGMAPERARAMALNFAVQLAPGPLEVTDGLCPVEAIGFGCVLIRRDVITRLAPKVGEIPGGPSGGGLRDFFGRMKGAEGLLSEDYSFCQRVRAMGETIWGDTAGGAGHVGRMTFSAPFIDHLHGLSEPHTAADAEEAQGGGSRPGRA